MEAAKRSEYLRRGLPGGHGRVIPTSVSLQEGEPTTLNSGFFLTVLPSPHATNTSYCSSSCPLLPFPQDTCCCPPMCHPLLLATNSPLPVTEPSSIFLRSRLFLYCRQHNHMATSCHSTSFLFFPHHTFNTFAPKHIYFLSVTIIFPHPIFSLGYCYPNAYQHKFRHGSLTLLAYTSLVSFRSQVLLSFFLTVATQPSSLAARASIPSLTFPPYWHLEAPLSCLLIITVSYNTSCDSALFKTISPSFPDGLARRVVHVQLHAVRSVESFLLCEGAL